MTTTLTEKKCSKCGEVKPLDDFYRAKASLMGRKAACKDCCLIQSRAREAANPDRVKAYRRMLRADGRAHHYHLRSKYGMGRVEYERLLAQQGGGCAICSRPPPAQGRLRHLVVDHDHTTGRIRGLLCSSCNTSLGRFGDSVHGLRDALAYLERAGD